MKSLAAHLLVAVPQLPDTNFFRTVVLMIAHNEEGAFGLVLNRPTEVCLSEIWPQLVGQTCDSKELIRLGGPVDGPLIAIHGNESFGEQSVLDGVFLSKECDNLVKLVDDEVQPIRFFSGCSGWAPDQLEGEIEAGGWLVTKAEPKFIFQEDDDLWKSVAGVIGNSIALPNVQSDRIPDDPSMN